ncbi:MAG: hypothetical protein N2117_08020 [Anaerolineales bacterium]|nr:hypothetical protein [Anaerolineales bacterium]MCX7755179.1 hypothetical protein [Anaerolineales bacterium]MDW8278780.1 hypothetical protein [Anaerolineales bacterium]
MTSQTAGLLGLVLVLVAALALTLLSLLFKRFPLPLRNISAFLRIRRAASLVVEDGTRLHVSLGSANLLTPSSASALAGLALVRHLGEVTSLSDHPPITTTGSPTLNLLAQDTLRTAHEAVATEQPFDMNNGRLTGLTPLSYAAGVMPAIRDENISNNVIIGSFGPEVGLLIESADRQKTPVIAASDSLPAQAVLYAATQEPLIGEELFAAGAYTQAGPAHTASLLVQDILRWLVILALLGGAFLKMAGLL